MKKTIQNTTNRLIREYLIHRVGQHSFISIKTLIKGKQDDWTEWNHKISKTYNWLRKQNENNDKKITFEYWTTSDFTEEAQKLLAAKSSITKKYTINWKNRIEILNFFRAHNLSEQCKILNEYYSVWVYLFDL